MTRAPAIAFFAFNRPGHTARTLDALGRCAGAAECDLVAHIDGPRNPDEIAVVREVASLFEANLPFRHVTVIRSPVNQGLYRSMREGISGVLASNDEVIVVEDDILVTKDFLRFMRDALERYRNEPRVGSVHGYTIPVTGLPGFYFVRGGDCWGWATWRDRWTLFEDDAGSLLRDLVDKQLLDAYMDTQGAASLRLLCDRAIGRNQSWAILWHTSLWLAGRLTLQPGSSFVSNIGNDGSGTHTPASSYYGSGLRTDYSGIPHLPLMPDISAAARASSFYDDSSGLSGRLKARVGRWLARRRAVRLAGDPR